MASVNILKYLKRKKSGTYESPVYIGTDQRFITAIRGTSNNNLEEQNLLGLDCIKTSYWENTTLCTRTEFRSESKTNEFYFLETREYNAAANGQIFGDTVQFDTDLIYFENVDVVIESDKSYFEGEAVVIPSDLQNAEVITLSLEDEGFKKTREDHLYYRNKNNVDIEVSIKTTYKKEENGITTVKSIITNQL